METIKRIRPLKGQALVQLLPNDSQSAGGILIPDQARGKMEKARVVKLGPWATNKKGLALIPEVKPGDVVIIANNSGTKARGEVGHLYKLVEVAKIRAKMVTS